MGPQRAGSSKPKRIRTRSGLPRLFREPAPATQRSSDRRIAPTSIKSTARRSASIFSSECDGTGAGVLVRALEPLARARAHATPRRDVGAPRDLCRGPGRLCRALAIDRSFDGADLFGPSRLWLARGDGLRRDSAQPRIGVTRAADRRLRYYEAGNPYVSGPAALSPP